MKSVKTEKLLSDAARCLPLGQQGQATILGCSGTVKAS